MTTAGPLNHPDRYELLDLKSSGGEGQVFRGLIDIDGARIPVAVKIIHPSRMVDMEEWRARWQRQAELLRSLDHPGLVKVREVFEGPLPHERGQADRSTNTLYLVMNWVEGPTLDEWVSRNPNRDLLDSARVLGKLASAVDYLHSGAVTGNPVLHRDIKPANVILSANGSVLVDFGFTRVLANQSMTMVGTPAYVPPETVSHGEHSTASDRYSLGATAYYMITGTVPTPNNRAAMVDLLTRSAGAVGRTDIAEHVLSMMDADPTRRPSAAVAWAQQLGAAAVSDVAPATLHRPPGGAPLAPPSVVSGPLPPPPNLTSGPLPPPTTTFNTPAPSTIISQPLAPAASTPAAAPWSVAAEPPAYPGTPSAKKGRGKLLAAVGVLVALLAAGLVYVALARGGDDEEAGVSVPSPGTTAVIDEDSPTATTAAAAQATTTDAPTTTAAPTTTIELIKLPRLQNLTVDQATKSLTDRGLVAEIVEEEGPGPYDKVKATEPASGEEIAAGETVVLTVPIKPTTMIEIANLPLTQAQSLMKSYEVTLTPTDVLGAEGIKADKVIDQTPKPGEPWSDAVTIVVERQPLIQYITELNPVENYCYDFRREPAQVNGQFFTQNILIHPFSNQPAFVEYDLARGYRILRGSLGLRDDSPSASLKRVEIFLDGARVYEKDLVLGQLEPIELDVAGALRLRIQVSDLDTASGIAFVVFGDLRLLGVPSEVPKPPTT